MTMLERRRRIVPHAERLRDRIALLDLGARRLVEICAALPDVRALYAFGSYASGAIRIRSDLDVLIVRATTLRRAVREDDIRIAFDVSVGLDLIVVTPDEFTNILPTTSFGQTILRTMRRLDAAG